MVRNSPRARAGLSRLAASPAPGVPPAPTRVWASSMNRITGFPLALISSMTPFSRCSNSPFTPAPASSSPRSRPRSATSRRISGTSPWLMRRASPSTTAVLPTPGSPTQRGLFLRRRARMSTIRRISPSRPNTGSMPPSRAFWVKSWQKRRRKPPSAPGAAGHGPGAAGGWVAGFSADGWVTVRKSRARVSRLSCRNSCPARPGPASAGRASRARSTPPERITVSPRSMELTSQASWSRSRSSGENTGLPALPACSSSRAASRAWARSPGSRPNRCSIGGQSPAGSSRSMAARCSTVTS